MALILDVMGLAQQSGIVSDMRSSSAPTSNIVNRKDDGDMVTMLLLKSPDDGRMAIPLDRVSRLETVSANLVETVGDQMVLRHGEDIMPLVSVNAVIPERRTVFRSEDGGKAAGRRAPERRGHAAQRRAGRPDRRRHPGRGRHLAEVAPGRLTPRHLSCVVIHDRVTELLDLDWVLANVNVTDEPSKASA